MPSKSNAPIVQKQSYGKSQVRLSRIHRDGTRHEFIDLTVSIQMDGAFGASYAAADNSNVLATDTMKNTVYVLAGRHGVASLEQFARLLARHFLDTYAHVSEVHVDAEEKPWMRMALGGKEHDHAFLGGSSQRHGCSVVATRAAKPLLMREHMACSITGLQVLKTTGSGFSHFLRDQYTTLPETDDRIFATSIAAGWSCGDLEADWTGARESIRAALLDVFANQYSKSVQHTLYEMGRAALAVCPLIDAIEITMPNQHHLLANLQPFGLENPNEVFVPTSEPFGKISATIARGDAANEF